MWRSLLALKPRDVPVRVALRNTLAIIAPLAIGIASGHVEPALAIATGALNTMFTDQPGPYRLRMQRMLLAAAAAGLAALTGITVGGHLLPFIAATLGFAFFGGLVVALGPMAARMGLSTVIVLLVTASMDIAPASAPGVAALIIGGGVLQALFAIAAWPLQRYRPERFALADVLQQLADTARARPDAAQQPAVSQAAVEALVLLHGEYRSRGEAMRAFRIIAEICERARIDLLALSDLHARLHAPAARTAIAGLLDTAAAAFSAHAEGMRMAQPSAAAAPATAAFEAIAARLPDAEAIAADNDARLLRIAQARAESLAGQLRSLRRNASFASSRGEAQGQRIEARLPTALRTAAALPTLRANLGLDSVAFRHALRCAACVGAAAFAARALSIPHGVWIPMTAAIVLKPDFGGTLRFGVLRVAGTLAGLLLVSLLAHYAMGDAWLRLLLLAALCIGFRLTVTVHYAIGVALLTGMVVVLLSYEGMAPADAIHARVVATLAGSALALAAYAAWPTWEGRACPPCSRPWSTPIAPISMRCWPGAWRTSPRPGPRRGAPAATPRPRSSACAANHRAGVPCASCGRPKPCSPTPAAWCALAWRWRPCCAMAPCCPGRRRSPPSRPVSTRHSSPSPWRCARNARWNCPRCGRTSAALHRS